MVKMVVVVYDILWKMEKKNMEGFYSMSDAAGHYAAIWRTR
jgi:hypothetical protein